jgi:glucose-1-phosphate thymidylyltransferase
MIGLLGDGTSLGVELTYRVQSNPDGIAGALKLCEDWAQGENVVVVLGDNLLENGIKPIIDTYKSQGEQGGMIAVIEVPDPHRFGVATLDPTGKVINLVEKPKDPESNLAVIGVYLYDSEVWSIIPTLKPSARGEYEITDVNRAYMNRGNLYCTKVTGWWTDAGTIESLFDATILMHNLKRGVK